MANEGNGNTDPPLGDDVARNNNGGNRAFVPRTLRDYAVPRPKDVGGAIVLPTIEGDPPNLNPSINVVQQNLFHAMEHEDPHDHLQTFVQCCQTVRLNGASSDYVRLVLFPFTLRDKAKKWLCSLLRNSISTWTELSKQFLTGFFPHKRTAKIRGQITGFKHKLDEPLNEA